MSSDTKDLLEQVDKHLASANQAWLFGAGISRGAGIPLMKALTTRVLAKAEGTPHKVVLDALVAELPSDSHIEHLLSHLGDYTTLAERAKKDEAIVGTIRIKASALVDAHKDVLQWIAETIRWGHKSSTDTEPEAIGTFSKPLVTVDGHRDFVQALFETVQAGLRDRRAAVRLFSTNYDTLLEDALSLCGVSYWDGFSGGAVAFRSYNFGDDLPGGFRSHVIKLHGSIDWYLCDDGRVLRVRDGDAYPTRTGRVLIHPQATKYAATQRDPFAAQFDVFRRTLSTSENVLAVCGYGFGDDHINEEIECAMASPENRTTLLVFYYGGAGWADCLRKWQKSVWGKRLYIATEDGLYVGAEGPFCPPLAGAQRNWWTFEGVTGLLRNGAESYV